MTGYGRGECARDGFKVTVELSAVNRKSGEITLSLPRDLEPLEAQVRDEINKRVSRGRLNVRVAVHEGEDAGATAQVNTALAKAYAAEFAKLATELNLTGGVTLEALMRAPGVLEVDGEAVDAEAYWPAVQAALLQGLEALVKMREREGEHLATDLAERIELIRAAAGRIGAQAPLVQVQFRARLLERIKAAGLEGIAADDERMLKEVVLFADRSDITEELTRLQSHFKQFADCLKAKEPVGRTLDFLSQEMNREINTIGSKAQDAVISREVVQVKAELERFREQVQNVE
ncbi:MAG: YicC family protein [Pedosphaera sp. Tous-C6FEB]|nr:MAG: YicC family protein [Pedosphaera sp. Tous-C6FEB]